MFRTNHIRTKLAVALAVPLAALVAVAGFEVVTAAGEVSATRSQADLATSAVGPGSVVLRLQDERNRATIDLIGLGDAAGLPVATNEEARQLVDEAVPALQAELQGRGAEVAAAFEPAWAALGGLGQLRADIDGYAGPTDLSNDELANEVFSRYTDIIQTFFDATAEVALAVDDAALRNGVEIVDAAARQSEVRAQIVRSAVLAVVTGTTSDAATGQEVAALYERGRSLDEVIRANATGPYAGVADATFADPGLQSFSQQVEAFLDGGAVDIERLLDAVRSAPDVGYLGLRARVAATLMEEAERIEGEAAARQRLFAGVAAGALLLALVVTWLASRSITRPLTSLVAQAEEMASERLPAAVRTILDTPPGEDVVMPEVAPIVVKSRDEVAHVAAALSAVQASAVDLAVEQTILRRNISDSYINLGRRNQNLLSRQLDFITELERNESDPDTLEGLFRLDHLATRMRRNAESLLVLSGVEPPRQWSAPVKLSDVVRAALGEVEDYQRVVVRHLEPASVTGAVASDIAHVLAELIENGLSFSPPEQSVEVKGRLTTSGYTLAVTDNGLGMSAEELERANRRLAGEESFTVAPSRYLGHYVAGHLASRLGVVVELQDSPAGGITARVDVPMGLLANEETDPRLVKLQAAERAADNGGDGAAPAAKHLAPSEPNASAPPAAPAPSSAGAPEAPATPPDPVSRSASLTPNGLPRRGERSPVAHVDLDAPAAAPDEDHPLARPRHAASAPSDVPAPPAAPAEGSARWDQTVPPTNESTPGAGATVGSVPAGDVEPTVPVGPDLVVGSVGVDPAVAPVVPAVPVVPFRVDPAVAPAVPAVPVVPFRVDPLVPSDPLVPFEGSFDPVAPFGAAPGVGPVGTDRVSGPFGGVEPTGRPVDPAQPAAAELDPSGESADDEAPATVRGFGGLAVTRPTGGSLYSVAAQNARQAGAESGTDSTRTGLTRRVPGAQRPDVPFGVSRGDGGEVDTPPSLTPTSPEDVYSFLSSFQSGVARGRQDAHPVTDPAEDDR